MFVFCPRWRKDVVRTTDRFIIKATAAATAFATSASSDDNDDDMVDDVDTLEITARLEDTQP